MRIIMAPLVGAFLFFGGCAASHTDFQASEAANPFPAPAVVVAPAPTPEPRTVRHVAPARHVVKHAPKHTAPQAVPVPHPVIVEQPPAAKPPLPSQPEPLPAPVEHPGLLRGLAEFSTVSISILIAAALLAWIAFHFIRGFLAARKGQA